MGPAPILEPQLSCCGLAFHYPNQPVLADLSLDLAAGETVAILGRSGSGKTTLLKAINLLILPERGSLALGGQIYFDGGEPVFQPREVRSLIGMVFQGLNLFPNLTARRNITLALRRVKKLSSDVANREAEDMAMQLGVKHLLDRYPEALSGGEAQRIALARAMVLHPEILLLDEVTSALDPETANAVFRALVSLRTMSPRLGIIIVTHAMNFAIRFADRIGFLHEGKLIDLNKASEFLRVAKHPATKIYIKEISGGADLEK